MSRRTLLRTAGAAVGVAGVAAVGDANASAATTPASTAKPATFQLHASQLRTLHDAGTRVGDRVAMSGVLHHAVGGRSVGHLYSDATVLSTDVVDDGSPTRLEHHLLSLDDGTLTATGTVTVTGRGAFTITGGSGRYANAHGTYTTIQSADSAGGDAVLTVHLHRPEHS